jgi:hypothetical protein
MGAAGCTRLSSN